MRVAKEIYDTKLMGVMTVRPAEVIRVFREHYKEDLEKEVGKVFIHVLEDAGVYKCTEEGRAAFERFIATL